MIKVAALAMCALVGAAIATAIVRRGGEHRLVSTIGVVTETGGVTATTCSFKDTVVPPWVVGQRKQLAVRNVRRDGFAVRVLRASTNQDIKPNPTIPPGIVVDEFPRHGRTCKGAEVWLWVSDPKPTTYTVDQVARAFRRVGLPLQRVPGFGAPKCKLLNPLIFVGYVSVCTGTSTASLSHQEVIINGSGSGDQPRYRFTKGNVAVEYLGPFVGVGTRRGQIAKINEALWSLGFGPITTKTYFP